MSRLEDVALASGLVPDGLLRRVIKARVKSLVDGFARLSAEEEAEREAAVATGLSTGPVTVNTDDANRQHYELPPAFFEVALGPRLKYSSCYWPEGVADLAHAEEAMLTLTAERAGLVDGQDVLDLGCGWGSLALWVAEHYPRSRVLAVSNSHGQRRFIEAARDRRRLANLEVVTAEVGGFEPDRLFDRVVSVEMFEHVRNHEELLRRISGWLKPRGLLFVHVFCHRRFLYAFEPDGPGGWMAEHFFSGGMMPSYDHLPRLGGDLALKQRWELNGLHYALTLRAWLENLDRRRSEVMPILRTTYGAGRARLWLAHWRIFFMACEETFALDGGKEYFVAHYLFGRRGEDLTAQASL
ncbi:MAG: class I SAM-dependent methyltransferase [Thermoleophilia bacterium]|nr:class I SAM-dependent methyltransferase [Thermoleophilia bacterium]